ncbi:hypothetical protein BHE74_00054832 [Ensete ventricosum]|nr:hypothetical protein BHE74_00054832 [Ensete ventricosum]RZS28135.1 hypothetical protein BHM03_00061695 [Ensete ventricosum]
MATTNPLVGATGYGQTPYKGVVDCSQAPCKGWPAAAKDPLQGAATRRGNSPAGTIGCGQAARACCPWRDRKGQLLVAMPQVVAARCKASRGSPEARAVVGRSGCQQGRSAASPPAQGSNDSDDTDGGKERARASI